MTRAQLFLTKVDRGHREKLSPIAEWVKQGKLKVFVDSMKEIEMNQPYKGSCLCGGITFSVSSFSNLAANCHCTMCRKFHGAPFGTLVETNGLTWLSGEHLLKTFIGSNGTTRYFCNTCGSSIGFLSKGQPESNLEIAISSFDTDIPVKPDAHIYVNYKACWYEINDDLPVFKENRE